MDQDHWRASAAELRGLDQAALAVDYEAGLGDRHRQGAYYTPPAEARFICREALRAYLASACPAAEPEGLARLVYGEPARGLPAAELLAALARITVCDPAAGAGTLLVAMIELIGSCAAALGQLDDGWLAGVAGRALYGCDTDAGALAVARRRIWLALLDAGAAPEDLPRLEDRLVVGDALAPRPGVPEVRWREAFPAIFARPEPGFDVLVANPPYVRHEQLDAAYKDRALAACRALGAAPGRKCDLYVYFFLRGVELLRPGGVMCLICSNSWLDAGYGVPLQDFLLRRTRLLAIYDQGGARSFAAEVNTTINLLQRADPGGSTARFVAWRKPFAAVTAADVLAVNAAERFAATPAFTVFPRPQAELAREGGKWGGRYLRRPDVFAALLRRGQGRLLPLGEVARLETYLNTGGADGFFIVRPDPEPADQGQAAFRAADGARWVVEAGAVRPFVKSPGELDRPLLDPARARWLLVRPAVADGPLVRAYVAWGEGQGYQLRAGCRRRRPWWRLPAQAERPGRVLWGRLHHDRHLVAHNPEGVACTNFYALHHGRPLLLAALLNASVFALLKELLGKTNFGGGVLKTDGNDVAAFPCPDLRLVDPDQEARLAAAFARLAARPQGPLPAELGRPDRRELDEAAFDLFGLSAGERDGVREALLELLARRLAKARQPG